MADTDLDRFVALAFCRADLVFELDDDFQVVFAAGAAVPLLGVPAKTLKARNFLDLVTPSDRRLATELLEAARGRGRIDDVVIRLIGANHTNPAMTLGGYRVPDFDDHFFLAVKSNPVYQSEPPAETEIVRDAETGLLDEAAYATLAAERAQALQRAGGRPQITLVKIDKLDQLTSTLGVSERKEICAAVGEILAEASLGGDTASRLDSDTFSYLHSDSVDTEEVGLRIADAAKRLFKDADLRPQSQTLDADGAGMTEQQVAKAIAHTIRQYCDQGEDSRKKSLSQVLKGMVSDTIDSVAYLRKVIAGRDFDVVYMPVCDLRTSRILHFEALTRFRDGKPGTSPYHLFSLAEEVGIIADLDQAVCETVIGAMVDLIARNPLMPPMAINLSGMSITNPIFIGELRKIIARTGIQPHKILFELTESARIAQIAEANQVIQQFRRSGIRFCLDDFGSGSASFDYLNALDVDVVKFDGPVVKRACGSDKGGELLASMARMCANMGVRSCAEMVEDKRTAARVAACGVDLGQGWHLGKPHADPFVFTDRFVLE